MKERKRTLAASGYKFSPNDRFVIDKSTFVFGLFVDQSHVTVAGKSDLSEADMVEAYKLITAAVVAALGPERTEEICRAAIFDKM